MNVGIETVWRSAAVLGLLVLAGRVLAANGGRPSGDVGAEPLKAAEGLWLPNALPVERLKGLGFVPSEAWMERLRLASVRIGASGSFVSPDGLILTNHHVALRGLHNISTEAADYVAKGFLAKSQAEEVKLPGQEVSVLVAIEDVTGRVNAAVDAKLPPEEAVKARHAVFAEIERQSLEKTGYQSNVVTLYGGAMYHLYRYKRYSDVRLVFAPEFQAAFFGGDPDNFEYPRYCLDIALMRAYESGKPAHVDNYLRLSAKGVSEGELVFVSGHPAHTDRLLPVSALVVMRDVSLPLRVEMLRRAERALLDYSAGGEEAAREARDDLFGVQNWRKNSLPPLAALRGGLVEEKQRQEEAFRAALQGRADLKQFDQAWEVVAAAEKARAELELRRQMLETGWGFNSRLCGDARKIVRMAAEDAKPDAERLPEFTVSKREVLEHELFADYPSYPALEIAKLTTSLQTLRDEMGADDPVVKRVLQGKEPAARAAELVGGTTMGSAAERKRLYAGGVAAIASSADAMVRLMREIDGEARAIRRDYEAKVTEPEERALAEINRARFAMSGASDYPDATGTLRFSFGTVKGYEQDGEQIPAWTTFAGAFAHEREHGGKDPYVLPARWKEAAGLDRAVPLDFVCTADTIGGNSGSPVVNAAGEQVGIIFDGNRQGLTDDLMYTDKQARSIAVDSRGILEGLREIYHADALVKELTGK